MKKNNIVLITLFSILMLGFSCDSTRTQNFEEALKTAKEQNKKVIDNVYTDWCVWCKKMDRDAYSNPVIKQMISDNFVFVKLDAESDATFNYNGKIYKSSEIAALFDVSGYPTMVFLRPDGTVIDFNYDTYKLNNLPGYYKAGDFKKVLEYFRDDKYKDTDLNSIL
jgi:thioredoxin-related protein